jgi:hypothetical protein
MAIKQNIVRLTSPQGTAVYPKIEKPDTKFNADGLYSIDLDLPGGDAQELIGKLTKIADDAYAAECKAKGKKSLKRSDMPWKETEDGKTRFKFKLKAKGGSGEKMWDQKPALFDAKGNPVKDLNVGSGSTVKVAFDVVPYFTAMVGQGISLRLRAVQVIELRQYIAGDNFDAFGFKATDGFVKEQEAVTSFDSDTDNDF